MDRVVIIEDEKLAADKLAMLLKKIHPQITVLAVIKSVQEAVSWLSVNNPDLIFLDIYLADDISFKIFERIQVDTPIIFTTAYDQHAIEAFKVNSIDYILKPIDELSLRQAWQKYQKQQRTTGMFTSSLEALVKDYTSNRGYRNRFTVTYGSKSKIITTDEIAFFFAKDRTVFLTTFSNDNFLIDIALDRILDDIDPKVFFKVNRKIVVNINSIREMVRFSSRKLKLVLSPHAPFDVIVPTDTVTTFRNWVNS